MFHKHVWLIFWFLEFLDGVLDLVQRLESPLQRLFWLASCHPNELSPWSKVLLGPTPLATLCQWHPRPAPSPSPLLQPWSMSPVQGCWRLLVAVSLHFCKETSHFQSHGQIHDPDVLASCGRAGRLGPCNFSHRQNIRIKAKSVHHLCSWWLQSFSSLSAGVPMLWSLGNRVSKKTIFIYLIIYFLAWE